VDVRLREHDALAALLVVEGRLQQSRRLAGVHRSVAEVQLRHPAVPSRGSPRSCACVCDPCWLRSCWSGPCGPPESYVVRDRGRASSSPAGAPCDLRHTRTLRSEDSQPDRLARNNPHRRRRCCSMAKIMYTRTDEAPLLATYSLKPIVEAFARTAGVEVETRDISLAGRIIALFPARLTDAQRLDAALAELGEPAKTPGANIIKLPNISASGPQLKAAIAELQSQGYDVPDYPEDPQTDEEKDVRKRYDSVKGSAVNPVLREGNSDRRAPKAIKQYAKKYPHSMGEWTADSKTSVATMGANDFASNELSVVSPAADTFTVRFTPTSGEARELTSFPVLEGEVVDGTYMDVAALDQFLTEQIAAAKESGVLFSVHLKATMMKVSDPVLFGHVVRAFLPEVFSQYGEQLAAAGLSADDGLGAILAGLDALDAETAAGVRAAVQKGLDEGPALAMVNSAKGITNLHVPSDVIVDASMPAMIRVGGKMWGADDQTHDTLAVIPDSSYAGVFEAVINDCKANGAYDP